MGYNASAVPTVKPAPEIAPAAADAAMVQAINPKAIISPLLYIPKKAKAAPPIGEPLLFVLYLTKLHTRPLIY